MKIKALLIEDDPKLRLLFKRMLEKNFDLHVIEAQHGVDGLTMLHKEKPVIVFLDVEMPLMNGIEFLEKIRSDRETQNLIIVMMTATDDSDVVSRILELGVSDYILKTERYSELTSRLTKILAKHNATLIERMGKNLIEGEEQINNKIVLPSKPAVLADRIRFLLEGYCELHFVDSGAECLSEYLEEKPAYVIVTENTPVLDEVKIRGKIKTIDTEKLTDVILLYTDPEYPELDQFELSVRLSGDTDSDVAKLREIISSKIPRPGAEKSNNTNAETKR